jgi:4-hydroxy 2-oxovalerate aldolase
MNHAKLLDCTLRDGGYLIDKSFGTNTIKGIVKGLVEAKIDVVEIGFLQNEGFGEGKTVYLNSKDAEQYILENKGNTQFTVLADYSRYSVDNLDEYTGKSFDGVRACFFKNERYDAMEFFKGIKNKGYKLYIQPVDILGYSDVELINLINNINELEPYCFSIVDTFGSMYMDDLQRIYSLINHNLISTCRIGFHSHNNMQMSNALSQEFLKITFGQRNVVVDTTLCGMGRGAGNTPTELIAQFMVSKLNYSYDMDSILDIIDGYMDNIRTKCDWGYTIPYFIAGCYSAHVNNITYLKQKNSISAKDIRFILNKIGCVPRKGYNYDLLENTYLQYLQSNINDNIAIKLLNEKLEGKNVIIIAPGNSVSKNIEYINKCIYDKDAKVIMVNFINDEFKPDFLYFSNIKRYKYWANNSKFEKYNKIVTSNIIQESSGNQTVVSFAKLVKCGWEHLDNSVILLLRLLDCFNIKSIGIAGFDGYDYKSESKSNYVNNEMEVANVYDSPFVINKEIEEMLRDYINTRKKSVPITFITESRFSKIM